MGRVFKIVLNVEIIISSFRYDLNQLADLFFTSNALRMQNSYANENNTKVIIMPIFF